MIEKFAAALNKMRSTRLRRFSLQVFVFYLAGIYAVIFVRWAKESQLAYAPDNTLGATMSILCWIGFAILYRTLVYDRIAFYAGLIAGFTWFFFGDAVVMPFWAGSMALLVHLYRSRRDFTPLLIWYLFIATVPTIAAYTDQYSLMAHPFYLVLFVVLLIAYFVYEYAQKVNARRKAAIEAMREEAELAKEEVAFTEQTLDQQIARLEKMAKLPELVQQELTDITAAARQIRHCMETDKRDSEPGRQFLQRYLPIVENIVTKGQTLARQLEDPEKRQQSITEQLDALASLRQAFRQHHQKLLENDSDDLSIEIKVLEKILKTDGYNT